MENETRGMKQFMLMLLLASGIDIVAPEPIKEAKLKELGLEEGDEAFSKLNEILEEVSEDKRLALIKGAMVSNLTPTQLLTIHDFLHGVITGILDFCKENPEYKKEPSDPEEALSKIFNI